jgi:sugar-specific transcriptional regulator TrmB
MKKLKPWLVLALVFAAGVVAGSVTTRLAVRHFVLKAIAQPETLRDRVERELVRRLDLTEAQKPKVHAALTRAQERLQALRAEFQPRLKEILDDAGDEIRATLTPEQRERFERFRAAHRVGALKP